MIEMISGISASIDLVKKLYKLNEKVKNSDFDMLIADLNSQLAEAKNAITDLQSKNRALEEEIKLLKERKKETLIFRNGAYFDIEGDGPFCPGCYDKSKQKSRLIKNAGFESICNFRCGVCGKPYPVTAATK